MENTTDVNVYFLFRGNLKKKFWDKKCLRNVMSLSRYWGFFDAKRFLLSVLFFRNSV